MFKHSNIDCYRGGKPDRAEKHKAPPFTVPTYKKILYRMLVDFIMVEVLVSPGKFFENLDNFGYRIVAGVALLSAIPSALTQYLVVSSMITLFPPDVKPFLQLSSIFGLIFSFIAVFVIILIVAGIVHLISGIFGGEGEFVRTATVTGYGMIPAVILSYIQLAIFMYYFNQVGGFETLEQVIAFFTNQTRLMSGVILSIAGTFWSVAVMSVGISKIRRIEYSKALISCLIPFMLYLAYTVYGIYSVTSIGKIQGLSAL